MSETTQPILKTQGKDPIPQYYNSTNDSFEAVKGRDGAINVNRIGLKPNTPAIYNGKVTWTNSASVNTQNIVDISLPTEVKESYLICITNPSTESDLSVSVCNKFTDIDSIVRYPELVDITVLKGNSDGFCYIVNGAFLTEGLRIKLSNDTVLGSSGGFSSYIHIRQV